jgi:hypothetical protein
MGSAVLPCPARRCDPPCHACRRFAGAAGTHPRRPLDSRRHDPHHLQPKIKQRLYALSPRAFEFFAGDLLTFMGLAAVTVTRYSGDGGIDASCELISGGILRVPAGVR